MASDIYQCIRTLQEGVFCTHALVDGLHGHPCVPVDVVKRLTNASQHVCALMQFFMLLKGLFQIIVQIVPSSWESGRGNLGRHCFVLSLKCGAT